MRRPAPSTSGLYSSITGVWSPFTGLVLNGTAPAGNATSRIQVDQVALASSLGSPGADQAITDIYGDPAYVAGTPYPGGFAVTYTTTPDCANCTGTSCPATSADVAVIQHGEPGEPVAHLSLAPSPWHPA